jgi:aryl-alcohol dehydrogenase-like predicted oxidoreductase
MDQLKTDIDAFNINLPDELLREIQQIYEEFPDPHA